VTRFTGYGLTAVAYWACLIKSVTYGYRQRQSDEAHKQEHSQQ